MWTYTLLHDFSQTISICTFRPQSQNSHEFSQTIRTRTCIPYFASFARILTNHLNSHVLTLIRKTRKNSRKRYEFARCEPYSQKSRGFSQTIWIRTLCPLFARFARFLGNDLNSHVLILIRKVRTNSHKRCEFAHEDSNSQNSREFSQTIWIRTFWP
jgi:hypothetical protein